MIEVYSSDSTIEAQLVAQRLSHHGLHPILKNEDLASMVGMGSIAMPCSVCVPVTEASEAKAILKADLEDSSPAPLDTPTHCPHCNAEWEAGFEVCWNCQKSL